MSFANSLSVPEIFSATTVATSLADLIIRAIMASSTFIVDPSSKYNLLGDREAAILETFNLVWFVI